MYFNFKGLSDLREASTKQLTDFSVWAQLTSFASQWQSITASVSKSYAQVYALVQQSQYDKDGNIQDVTSQGRLTVPEDVLAQARANLIALKSQMANCAKPAPSYIKGKVVSGDASNLAVKTVDLVVYGHEGTGWAILRVDFLAHTITNLSTSSVTLAAALGTDQNPRIAVAFFGDEGGTLYTSNKLEYALSRHVGLGNGFSLKMGAVVNRQGTGPSGKVTTNLIFETSAGQNLTFVFPYAFNNVLNGGESKLGGVVTVSPFDSVGYLPVNSEVENEVVKGISALQTPHFAAVGEVTGEIESDDIFTSLLDTIPVDEAIQALTTPEVE